VVPRALEHLHGTPLATFLLSDVFITLHSLSTQDTLLLEGVNLHGTGAWKKIAAHVGKSVTLCKQRWYAYLKPKPSGAWEDAKWTEAEVCLITFKFICQRKYQYFRLTPLLRVLFLSCDRSQSSASWSADTKSP